MKADHRHSYKWVVDGPNYMTYHRECKVCGIDPVTEWYKKQLAKAEKKAEKSKA